MQEIILKTSENKVRKSSLNKHKNYFLTTWKNSASICDKNKKLSSKLEWTYLNIRPFMTNL